VETFVRRKDEILSGAFDEELMASSTARTLWGSLKRFAKLHVRSPTTAAAWKLSRRRPAGPRWPTRTRPSVRGWCISENYRRIAEAPTNRMPMRYRELQLITDMISGMSDSFALSLRRPLGS
jgi:dGTPase